MSSAIPINGGDTIKLTLEDNNGNPFILILNNVIYLLTSRCNLILISRLTKAGIIGSWNVGGGYINLITENFTIGRADLKSGLYYLKLHSLILANTLDEPFAINIDFTNPI